MKVLHICSAFSPLSETFIYDYITELERQGIENHVLTFHRLNEQDRPFDRVYVVQIKHDMIWLVQRLIAQLSKGPGRYFSIQRRAMRKIIEQVNPDVIHAHFGPMGVLVAPIAKQLKIPLIVSFHGYDASSLIKEKFWVKEYQRLNSIVKFVTVVSNDMKLRLERFYPNKIKVVHVGKRLADYSFIFDINTIKNFLSVGRLTEKKGYFDLIKAFSSVLQEYPYLSLDIIGDGHLKNELQKFIITSNTNNRINLLGPVQHERLIEYYMNSDAFILTSKTAPNGDMEGIPTVLIEAQFLGLPVISTKHSGIPEVIPDENHVFLAEEGNIEQIKQCIIRLINTEETELKEIIKRGRLKVENEFNLHIEVKKLINLYTN
mgnify:CR=1 FL=1